MSFREFENVKKDFAFTQVVFRIEMIDFIELHLTIVDLSKLISIVNDEQTKNDVQVI